jgi:glycerol-3-phosphate dehydrogenase
VLGGIGGQSTFLSSAAASMDAASPVTPSVAAIRSMLAEMKDLASGTSSGSTKLIHGGLRYLEHYEFRLVREALMEREVLWKNGAAYHLADALRAAATKGGPRPAWLLRIGLFLYDSYRRPQAACRPTGRSTCARRIRPAAAEAIVPQGL